MKAVKRNVKRTSASAAMAPRGQLGAVRVPISPPTEVELRGIPIHFPFQPYKCQEDYMDKVLDALNNSENALLESPTGTGKTLCLLCAALAWQREKARSLHSGDVVLPSQEMGGGNNSTKKQFQRVPTIIYASRTHSQLSQVVRELRNTRYRPKHAVLGSREQMCVHPKVKKASSTGAEINHDCNKLGKDRKCRFKNKLEGFQPPSNESGSTGTQPVMDMEDLVSMGNTHKVCPFFYTRSLVEEAELILVPYNYLFDKDSRTSTLADVPWDNSVVIFDEAHNLESFASESASFDLTSTDIAGCVHEIQRGMGYKENSDSKEDRGIKEDNIVKLKSIFLQLEEYVLNLNNSKTAYRGEFMMEVLQQGARITHANHELFINEIRKVSDLFMQHGGINSRGAAKLEHFVQCIKRVYGEATEARCLAKAQSYRVHVTPKSNKHGKNGISNVGRTVSYWCFAPAEAMRELANLNVRSIIVTSGTLSPLESYALELDLPFPNRLENPHIIPHDQIHVRVLGKGVSGKVLTSSYERRQQPDYYQELGNTLVSLGKVIPGGMLVFFPSYGVMETCMERWGGPANSRPQANGKPTSSFFAARKKKITGSARYSFPYAPTTFSSSNETLNPWKRLLGTKAVVVEPRATADLPDAIAEFHKFLNLPKSKGVALFGVCRGKISEGIDFAHDMCRAVIITGLPFAPSFDPKVKMKREFLDQNRASQNIKASSDAGFGVKKLTQNASLSGHEWYTQQAHRAVNQAIGRVIRNKNDYGAVLLLDSRFNLPGNQQGLSKWVRPHIQPDEGVGRTISGLVKFYRSAENKVRQREKEPPLPPAPNQVSIILKYEEEGEEAQVTGEEEFTKIAFIGGDRKKSTASASDTRSAEHTSSSSPTRNYIPPEQIIARVDMKTNEGTQKASVVLKNQSITGGGVSTPASTDAQSDDIPTRLPSNLSQASSGNTKASRSNLSTPAPTSRSKTAGSSPSQTAAKKFFLHVQSHMSTSEQSTIKKAVVAMKQFTHQKHRKAFLNAACEIINIILLHENFENRSKGNKPEVLVLLFHLLPKHFVKDAQKWTMYIVLQASSFGTSMKATLPSADCRRCLSDTTSLICGIWFDGDSDEQITPTEFLRRLQNILALVHKHDHSPSEIPEGLLKLIPFEYRSSTIAFFDQIKASRKISRLKEIEKTGCGENAVKTTLFRSSQSLKHEGVSNEANKTTKKVMVPLTSSVERKDIKVLRDVKPESAAGLDELDPTKKRSNPYLVSKAAPKQSLNAAGKVLGAVDRPMKVRRGLQLGSLLEKKSKKLQAGTVKKLLNSSESDTYTGKATVNVTESMNSNAPKNLTCTICDTASDKPFIAECGHMACLNCWLRWFKKSETCPVCRRPASRESLALAVFKKSHEE